MRDKEKFFTKKRSRFSILIFITVILFASFINGTLSLSGGLQHKTGEYSGGPRPVNGTVILFNQDVSGTNAICDAEFILYEMTDSGENELKRYYTDEDGYIYVREILYSGKYCLRETAETQLYYEFEVEAESWAEESFHVELCRSAKGDQDDDTQSMDVSDND